MRYYTISPRITIFPANAALKFYVHRKTEGRRRLLLATMYMQQVNNGLPGALDKLIAAW